MSLDERIPVKSCMFGCHSELDRLSKREPFECGFETRETEKACTGCSRRTPNDERLSSGAGGILPVACNELLGAKGRRW